MNRTVRPFLGVILVALLAACAGATVPTSPTVAPTTQAATPLPVLPTDTAAPTDTVAAATSTVALTAESTTATIAVSTTVSTVAVTVQPAITPVTAASIAVQQSDNSVQLVDSSGSVAPAAQLENPVDLASIFPPGNVLGSALYLPVSGPTATVVRIGIDASGAQPLNWIKGPLYGLAVSPTRIAWGTADLNGKQPSALLMMSMLDGSDAKAVLTETSTNIPHVLRPIRWSWNQARLFFGKEPLGLGGYILFVGITNLWSYDMNSGKSTELVHERAQNAAICIDDLAPNEKVIADHCRQKNMVLTDLSTKVSVVIQAPASVPRYGLVGGARFSPDSSRLAYGLARQDPENEQGWVAISEGSAGTSKLTATSPAHDYFAVVGWLDANTIVLQSQGQKPGVWTVGADGSNLKRLADGIFMGITAGQSNSTGQSCGDIRMLGPNAPQDPSALQAEDCFWQAYQVCSAATLTVTLAGVDAGTINQFGLTKNGNQCQVTDRVTHYVVPRPTAEPVAVMCGELTQQQGGLLFRGCGDQGDIFVPSP